MVEFAKFKNSGLLLSGWVCVMGLHCALDVWNRVGRSGWTPFTSFEVSHLTSRDGLFRPSAACSASGNGCSSGASVWGPVKMESAGNHSSTVLYNTKNLL